MAIENFIHSLNYFLITWRWRRSPSGKLIRKKYPFNGHCPFYCNSFIFLLSVCYTMEQQVLLDCTMDHNFISLMKTCWSCRPFRTFCEWNWFSNFTTIKEMNGKKERNTLKWKFFLFFYILKNIFRNSSDIPRNRQKVCWL